MELELRGITKRFPGVVANDNVNLTIRSGEVLALVGENGAGKSTLMNILYGLYHADEGEIFIDGAPVKFESPGDAIDAGIGMVHQHFMLVPVFTVAENVVLGIEPTRGLSLDRRKAAQDVEEISAEYGLGLDPNAVIEDLPVGIQQRVEISKVLFRDAEIVVFDEPTAVLTPQEIEDFFRIIESLKASGRGIVFITHKLTEALQVADRIAVLRRGQTVGEADPGEIDEVGLAEMMVGSELPTPATRESTVTDTPVLEVRGLTVASADGSGRNPLDDVGFVIHRGETLGIAGVEGNGQSELINALVGLVESKGTILVDGRDVNRLSTRDRRRSGIGLIAEDRQKDGLVLPFTLWENAALGHQYQEPYARGPWLDIAGAKQQTERIVSDFDVRTPGIEVPTFTLSGGNQQKLVVGREMTAEPKALVAAHPTRGVDVGAQAVIWDILRDARAAGLATLLISADLEELIGLSDRLLVMLRGTVVAEVDPQTVTPMELGSYMTGATVVVEGGFTI